MDCPRGEIDTPNENEAKNGSNDPKCTRTQEFSRRPDAPDLPEVNLLDDLQGDLLLTMDRYFIHDVNSIVSRQKQVKELELVIEQVRNKNAGIQAEMEKADADARQGRTDPLPQAIEECLRQKWERASERMAIGEALKLEWETFVKEEKVKLHQANEEIVSMISNVIAASHPNQSRQSRVSNSVSENCQISTSVAVLVEEERQTRSVTRSQETEDRDIEQQREIIIELHRATDHFDELQDEFDHRQDRYEYDLAQFQESVDAGANNARMSDFDRAQILYVSDLTRELAEAETSLENAVDVAREHGLLGHQLQEKLDKSNEGSIINSLHGDRRESFHQVAAWVDEVTDAENSPIEPESIFTEWDAESLGFGESLSTYAEGTERKDIDRWRSQCEKMADKEYI